MKLLTSTYVVALRMLRTKDERRGKPQASDIFFLLASPKVVFSNILKEMVGAFHMWLELSCLMESVVV